MVETSARNYSNLSQSRTFKAAVLGSGKFLVTITMLLCYAALSRIFTKADYAAYRQTILAFKFVEPLLALGLPLALYYFLPQNKEKGRSILSGNLLLLFSGGVVFAIAMWSGGNEFLAQRFSNPVLSKLLLIFSPYALFALPVAAMSACFVCYDRVKTLTIFNVTSRILFFIFVAGSAFFWRTPSAAVYGTVTAELVIFFPAIFLMYRVAGGTDWLPDKGNMWAQMKYCVPLGLAGMIGRISFALDKVIVSSMCTADEFATYVNGAMEVPLIGAITGSVMAIILPDLVTYFKENRTSEFIRLWQRAFAKCLMVLAPIMMFILVMAPEIMTIVFTTRYLESHYPFRVYALMLPLRATSFGAVLMAMGRSKLVTIMAAVGLLLNGILSVIFVTFLGPTGAAWATCLATYLMLAYAIIKIARILGCSAVWLIEWGRLSKIFGALLLPTIGIVCLDYYLPFSDTFRFLLSGILFVILVGISYHVAGILKFSDYAGKLKGLWK